MRAPALYWVCVVYLVVLVLATDYALITSPPPLSFPIIAAILTVTSYNLATLALLLRSRFTVPVFLAGFVIFGIGETWAIATTGLGPGFKSPEWLVTRSAGILIIVAIVYYCYRLTKREFLR